MVEQKKTGIVPFLTKRVKAFGGAINDAFSDKTGCGRRFRAEVLVELRNKEFEYLDVLKKHASGQKVLSDEDLAFYQQQYADAKHQREQVQAMQRAYSDSFLNETKSEHAQILAAEKAAEEASLEAKGKATAAAMALQVAAHKKMLAELKKEDAQAFKMQLETAVAYDEEVRKAQERAQKEGAKEIEESNRAELEAAIAYDVEVRKSQEEDQKKANEAMVKANHAAQKQVIEDGKKMEHLATGAGEALINALQQGMTDAAHGKDTGVDFGQLLKTIIPMLVQLVVTYYSDPAIGQLAGGAAKIIVNQFHTGGTVGQDGIMRFHSGGEVPAYLLPGERVLSHREIANMGGADAIDSQARGGGGGGRGGSIMVQVATFDSRSFSEYLAGMARTALPRALATGRGETAQLLRKLRRGN